MGRTELWFHVHKKSDDTYVNEAAKKCWGNFFALTFAL